MLSLFLTSCSLWTFSYVYCSLLQVAAQSKRFDSYYFPIWTSLSHSDMALSVGLMQITSFTKFATSLLSTHPIAFGKAFAMPKVSGAPHMLCHKGISKLQHWSIGVLSQELRWNSCVITRSAPDCCCASIQTTRRT